jgi:hypothetical protein
VGTKPSEEGGKNTWRKASFLVVDSDYGMEIVGS